MNSYDPKDARALADMTEELKRGSPVRHWRKWKREPEYQAFRTAAKAYIKLDDQVIRLETDINRINELVKEKTSSILALTQSLESRGRG